MVSCPKTFRPVVTASLSRALLDVLKDYATGGYRPGLADAAVESGLQVGACHSTKQALDRLVARLKVDEDGDVEERVSGKKIVAREDWQRVVLERHVGPEDQHLSPAETLSEVRNNYCLF